MIATPNHWHALMGVWACQAGKDVYVEKPVSHNIWEGRKLVEAARQYNRIAQTGLQNRSDVGFAEAAVYLREGNLGKICWKIFIGSQSIFDAPQIPQAVCGAEESLSKHGVEASFLLGEAAHIVQFLFSEYLSVTPMQKSLSYEAYQKLAEAYASLIETKPHNAYYDRPAVFSLINDSTDKTILDAGCGPGVYTEWLISKGAKVIGLDASEKMLEFARARNHERAEFIQANLEEPMPFFSDQHFDGIVSALAVTYVMNLKALFGEFNRILKNAGWIVFSTEHPFFAYKYFKIENYFETTQVSCKWRGFGTKVTMPSYFHSLGYISEAMTDNGFAIEKILEPKPTDEFKKADWEKYNRLMKFPDFICFKARKVKDIKQH